MTEPRAPTALIVVADDYGLAPAYDAGIVEAARAGAIDAVSAIAARDPDLGPLAGSGVEVGLHLELAGWSGLGGGTARAGPAERERAVAALGEQLDRFAASLGAPPAYLDGHRHCHAAPGLAAALAREAARRGLPVRSVSPGHRRTLRCLGVATPDRLVGRLSEDEPAVPAELRGLIEGTGAPPPGVTEWMVHPGRRERDPGSRSSYDAGREEDLLLLLSLADRAGLRRLRSTHAAALGLA